MLLCLGGCDALGVQSFTGSYIALDLTWPSPMLPGADEHLELWAVSGAGQPVRVPADEFTAADFPGFDVRLGIDPNEPCLIDAQGRLLLGPAADLPDPDISHEAMVQRVRQVVPRTLPILPAGGVAGKTKVPLLALVRHDENPGPDFPLTKDNVDKMAPADRLQRCRPFLCAPADAGCGHGAYYVGNPLQLTKPVHGTLYGFFDFNTIGPDFQTADPASYVPPQDYGGIAISTRVSLHGIRGLRLTREKERRPGQPGTPVALGVPSTDSGRGAARFVLLLPGTQTVLGFASVLTDLDRNID